MLKCLTRFQETEALHIFVSSALPKAFGDATKLAQNLNDTVRAEHAKAYPYVPMGGPPPAAGGSPAYASAPPPQQPGPPYGGYGYPPPTAAPYVYPPQGAGARCVCYDVLLYYPWPSAGVAAVEKSMLLRDEMGAGTRVLFVRAVLFGFRADEWHFQSWRMHTLTCHFHLISGEAARSCVKSWQANFVDSPPALSMHEWCLKQWLNDLE